MTIINFYKKYYYENFDKYPDGYEYETGVAKVVPRVDWIGKVLELYSEGGIVQLSKHGYKGYKLSDIEGLYIELWYDGDDTENGITIYLETKKGDESRMIEIASGDTYPSWNPIVSIYYEKTDMTRNFRCTMVDAKFIALLITGRNIYVYANAVYDIDNNIQISEEKKWVKLIDIDVDYCGEVTFWLRKRKYHIDEICHGAFAWSPEEAFVRGLIDAINQLLPILLVLLFIVILVEVIRWGRYA